MDISHGRKGKSIWNELHGTLRDAKLGEAADINATGHTHNYAMQHLEIPERHKDCWLIQVSGYKEMDSYARDNGFSEYTLGSSVLAVIDPNAERPVQQCFEDIEAGYDYMQFLRGR